MRLGRFLKILLSGLFLVAALFMVAVEYSVIQSATDVQNYSAYQDSAKEYFEFSQTSIVNGVKWFGSLNAEELIALFTSILAVATILLWLATQSILRDSRHTTQQQLRAYMFLDGVHLLEGEDLKLRGRLKNAGQTPAHHVVCRIGWAIDYPGREKFEEPPQLLKDVYVLLAPGGAHTINFTIADFTRQHLLETGTIIYVWAKITYRDAFGFSRETLVRTYMKDIMTKGEIGFAYSDQGNEAT